MKANLKPIGETTHEVLQLIKERHYNKITQEEFDTQKKRLIQM